MLINIKKLIKYMGENKAKYFIIIIVSLVIEGLSIISFSYANKTIFNSLEYKDFDLFKVGLVIALLFVISNILVHLCRYLAITETRHIVFRIKNQMFEKLTNLDIDYFNENHTGNVIQKLGWSANGLKDLYFSTGYWVIRNFFTGLLATFLMFRFSWKLSVVSILISFLALGVSMKLTEKVYEKNKALYTNLTRLTEYIVDILSGFLIIKIYDNNNFIRNKYVEQNNIAYDKTVELSEYIAFKDAVMSLIKMISKFGVIFLGIYFVLKDEMDYGTLMAVISLQDNVSMCILSLSYTFSAFSSQLAYSESVFNFLELDESKEDERPDLECDYSKGIEIFDLTFGYKDREPILNNINFEVKADEKIMLCGESGCGKSTILKLLLRFYNGFSGDIKIYGNGIKDYPMSQLRQLITYIPQNSFLFDATVLENIKFGNDNASDIEIREAAGNAFATNFIENMTDGFDTIVEKGGSNMSGGQRQRISIARAFLRNSPIIIMDEPTSSLDSESEKEINLAMKKLMENKIVIMVTHKKIGVENFDRVVDM